MFLLPGEAGTHICSALHCVGKREAVAAAFELRRFEEGDAIVREGEKGDAFYIVESGEVDVTKGKITLTSLAAREYFGELALLKNERRKATATASEPTSCLVLTKARFDDLLSDLTFRKWTGGANEFRAAVKKVANGSTPAAGGGGGGSGGVTPRYCKKCKLGFTTAKCPGGHPNFVYSKAIPAGAEMVDRCQPTCSAAGLLACCGKPQCRVLSAVCA